MRVSGEMVGDRLAELLCAWRRDIRSVPMPALIDPVTAMKIVRQAARVRMSPDPDTRTRSRDR